MVRDKLCQNLAHSFNHVYVGNDEDFISDGAEMVQ